MPEKKLSWIEEVFELGAKRAVLLQQVTDLKRQHNAIIPIGRLPNEILSSIFSLTIVWDLSYNFAKAVRARSNKHLIHASHVCHRWRQIALQDPSLWTYWSTPVICRRSVFDEFRARSKNAPLTVQMRNGHTHYYAHIVDCAPRLKRLHINFEAPGGRSGASRYPHPTIVPVLVSPMPLLESVVFYRPEVGLDAFLPKNLFMNQAPRLKELVIACEMIDIKLSVFSKVTTLVLSKVVLRDSEALSRFKLGITCMKCLEALDLKECILDIPYVDKVAAFSLPKLRSLQVSGDLLSYSKFLGHLSIPLECSVNITSLITTSTLLGTQLFIDFLTSVIRHFPKDTPHIPWSMSFNPCSVTITREERYPSRTPFTLKFKLVTKKVGLEFRQQLGAIIPQVASQWRSFNIWTCPTLCLNQSSPFFDAMTGLLAHQSITTIGMRGEAAFDNMQCFLLASFSPVPSKCPHDLVYLRSLCTLSFCDTDFRQGLYRTKLSQILAMREVHGAPIKSIDVSRCLGRKMLESHLKDFEGLEVITVRKDL